MDQVAGAGRQAGQPLGVGQSVGRVAGGLGGVDVVVDGGGVVGLGLDDRLDDGPGLGRGRMVAPAVGGQQGLGRDQADVGLGGIGGHGLQQGGGEPLFGPGRLVGLVAVDHRLGETLLLVGPGDLQRLFGQVERGGLVGLLDVEVLGRPARQGLAPAAEGAVRIGRHGLVEGQLGVGVVEGVVELEPVVEPALGLGAGGAYDKAARADAGHEVDLPGALAGRIDPLGAADVADADGRGVQGSGARRQERHDQGRGGEHLHAACSSSGADFGVKAPGAPGVSADAAPAGIPLRLDSACEPVRT